MGHDSLQIGPGRAINAKNVAPPYKNEKENAEAGAVLSLRPHPTPAAGIIRPTITLNGAPNEEVAKREGEAALTTFRVAQNDAKI